MFFYTFFNSLRFWSLFYVTSISHLLRQCRLTLSFGHHLSIEHPMTSVTMMILGWQQVTVSGVVNTIAHTHRVILVMLFSVFIYISIISEIVIIPYKFKNK